jgi:hypothetical protein
MATKTIRRAEPNPEIEAPEISSDGGAILLRQIDERLGLTAGFAACLPDDRDPSRVIHHCHEQSRQRIFQVTLGYEDANDAHSFAGIRC